MGFAQKTVEDLTLTEAADRFGIARPALVIAVINRKVESHIKSHPKTGQPVYYVTPENMAGFMEDYRAGMKTNINYYANQAGPKKLVLTEEELASRLARKKIEAMRDARELGVDFNDLDEDYFE